MIPTTQDKILLETLFLDSIFPKIYTLSKNFIPAPCFECESLMPIQMFHSCMLPEKVVRLRSLRLAAVELQNHTPYVLSEINETLKNDMNGRFENVTLVEFLTWFSGENGRPNVITQLALNKNWLDILSAKTFVHEHGMIEDFNNDVWNMTYLPSDDEDVGSSNDSNRSIFGDV